MIYGHIEREEELVPVVVKVARPVRVKDVIRVSGLSSDEFLLLNADLKLAAKRNTLLPTGFRLHVPHSSRVSLERMMGIRDSRVASAATARTAY